MFLSEEKASCIINDNCMMSMDVVIMPTDGHPIFDTTNNQRINQIKSAVEIGKNVWVGMGAFIGKTTKFQDNTIIGARSVVTGDRIKWGG